MTYNRQAIRMLEFNTEENEQTTFFDEQSKQTGVKDVFLCDTIYILLCSYDSRFYPKQIRSSSPRTKIFGRNERSKILTSVSTSFM